MFLFETVFISEQVAEDRFGVLLEITDKFITGLNYFSYIILEFRLKAVWKIFLTILCDLKDSD